MKHDKHKTDFRARKVTWIRETGTWTEIGLRNRRVFFKCLLFVFRKIRGQTRKRWRRGREKEGRENNSVSVCLLFLAKKQQQQKCQSRRQNVLRPSLIRW